MAIQKSKAKGRLDKWYKRMSPALEPSVGIRSQKEEQQKPKLIDL